MHICKAARIIIVGSLTCVYECEMLGWVAVLDFELSKKPLFSKLNRKLT